MRSFSKKKILGSLANLQFAIGLLFTIGFVIALGSIIEQDKNLAFYQENYSEITPLYGFLSWKTIMFFNLNKIYSAWWFIAILFLFASSLSACTFTTQLPSLKTFKLWKFNANNIQYKKLGISDRLDIRCSNNTAYNCNDQNYHFFRQNRKSYAYSGLLGRVAPIVVHLSIILLLLGSTLGSFQGYIAQEIVPRGEIFHVQNLTKLGGISYIPQEFSCRVNDFWITYTKELKTDQFYSDLSILDRNGKELKRKTIFVNEPLLFKNLVFYQTDWDILGLSLRFDENKYFQLPLKKIVQNGRKFWFGSLDLGEKQQLKFTVLINDLNGKLYIYDSEGILKKETVIGDNFLIRKAINIQFTGFLTSTGLQMKVDPGIAIIYFSFLLLMVAVYVSFFTYSQIWLVEKKAAVYIGGKSNRAVLFFQEEFRKILKRSLHYY